MSRFCEATFLFLLTEWELPGASLVSQLVGSLYSLRQYYYVKLNILQQCTCAGDRTLFHSCRDEDPCLSTAAVYLGICRHV